MRLIGLDEVKPEPLRRADAGVPRPVLTLLQKRVRLAKRTLASLGFLEAVTWSFVSKARAALFGGGAPALALANPIAADLSDMRPSLLPGLIAAAQRNADRGYGDVALFEVGQVFVDDSETGQRFAAAGLRRGTARLGGAERHWSGDAAPVGLFDAKADALALLGALALPTGGLQIVPGGPVLPASGPVGDAATRAPQPDRGFSASCIPRPWRRWARAVPSRCSRSCSTPCRPRKPSRPRRGASSNCPT